jgi:hypothetical protein
VGVKESLATYKQKGKKMNDFYVWGWWMKGNDQCLICLGYGVMHATLEGYSSREIRGYK